MNLDGLPGWLLLLAYASVLVEMMVFAVPSEASTWQLFTGEDDPAAGRLGAARRRHAAVKFGLFLLPTALGVLLFLLPLAVAVWPRLWPWTLAVTPGPLGGLVWAGLGTILVGRFLTTTAVLHLRQRLHQDDHRLQPRGVFRYSRNPILLGMHLFYLGNCLWLPSPILWIGFVPYAYNMHRRVLMEEDFLTARLGTEYADYLRLVPRYVGRPAPESR